MAGVVTAGIDDSFGSAQDTLRAGRPDGTATAQPAATPPLSSHVADGAAAETALRLCRWHSAFRTLASPCLRSLTSSRKQGSEHIEQPRLIATAAALATTQPLPPSPPSPPPPPSPHLPPSPTLPSQQLSPQHPAHRLIHRPRHHYRRRHRYSKLFLRYHLPFLHPPPQPPSPCRLCCVCPKHCVYHF